MRHAGTILVLPRKKKTTTHKHSDTNIGRKRELQRKLWSGLEKYFPRRSFHVLDIR